MKQRRNESADAPVSRAVRAAIDVRSFRWHARCVPCNAAGFAAMIAVDRRFDAADADTHEKPMATSQRPQRYAAAFAADTSIAARPPRIVRMRPTMKFSDLR
ncbi:MULTISPECIES: hypothetical protein [Burkholderia]|uniref:Uncharacterized protein n=1 Tax=Burkholderia humptydooensis TaxID=430531 RepID=A0A7U4P5M9_9BURK|nr:MULTISPECIES: hypothetical protein [Burkholderia]ALX43378.1 hypothetical protein AQ610_13885 [Burkholderia humptydooensis]KVN11124.1 hypothetical protein WT08_14590 [Burkholderia sp. MSMB1552]KWZ55192.1 hypothetical protein WS92_04145 [Burkholderia sp. MSMB1588]QPS44709.1 hypothetical protein I6G56_06320 [Burkholderia humptydooensis]